jgi:hypothetical protein
MQSKTDRLFIFPVIFLGLILSFQNCGMGIKVESTLESESPRSQNSDIPDSGEIPRPADKSYMKVASFDIGNGTCHVNESGVPFCLDNNGQIHELSNLSNFKQFGINGTGVYCGIDKNNKLVCGQFDYKKYQASTPIIVETAGTVVKLAGSIMPFCALNLAGKVFCWKGWDSLDFLEISGIEGAIDIAVIPHFTCFIDREGILKCGNMFAQPLKFLSVGTKKYKSVSLVDMLVCAIAVDESLDCFQLFDGSYVPMVTPVFQKPILKITFANSWYNESDRYTFCAIDSDNDLYCWGANRLMLVDPNSVEISMPNPKKVAVGKVDDITLRFGVACARLLDQSVKCWHRKSLFSAEPFQDPAFENVKHYFPIYPETVSADAYRVDSSGRLQCLRSPRWELGWRIDRSIEPCALQPTDGFISFGNLNAVKKYIGKQYDSVWNCVLRNDGKVTCWGDSKEHNIYSSEMVLGNRVQSSQTPYGEIKELNGVVDIEELESGICALQSNGEVYCWGRFPEGTNSSDQISTRTPIKLPLQPNVVRIKQMPFMGSIMLVYQTQDGQLNLYSQTSEGKLHVPIATGVALSSIASVRYDVCGLNQKAEIVCWTFDSENKKFGSSRILASSIESLVSAPTHFCAKTKERKLMCFGDNSMGQLALGNTSETKEMKVSPILDEIDGVSVWDKTTCVTKKSVTSCVGLKSFNLPKNKDDAFWFLTQ